MTDLQDRPGSRPDTSTTGPHRQLSDRATPELWGRLIFEAMSIDRVSEGQSSVSMADSRALLLTELRGEHGEWSLATSGPHEPAHVHGVTDTSVHLCLPVERAREVCAKGWGEPHPYADYDTQVMVYAPRDAEELGVVLGLVRVSVAFALENGA
jgi:hypothetical protein